MAEHLLVTCWVSPLFRFNRMNERCAWGSTAKSSQIERLTIKYRSSDAEQCAARLLPQIIINTLTNDPLRQSSRALDSYVSCCFATSCRQTTILSLISISLSSALSDSQATVKRRDFNLTTTESDSQHLLEALSCRKRGESARSLLCLTMWRIFNLC